MVLLFLSGCAAPSSPKPPSLDLPKPPSDLRAVRKGNHVYLTWTIPTQTTDRALANKIGVTAICRSLQSRQTCEGRIGEVAASEKRPTEKRKKNAGKSSEAPRPATFTDTLPEALITNNVEPVIDYAVSVLNRRGKSAGLSNQVQISAVSTLPEPARVLSRVTADGVVLRWKSASIATSGPSLKFLYRVFRRPVDGVQSSPIGDVEWKPDFDLEFIDRNFEWEKTYDYVVTPVTRISQAGKPDQDVEGDDSETQRVFAHDVFPPAPPVGLQAVYSGAGQSAFVDLIWTPSTEGDLAGYSIYRRKENGQIVKLNSELIPTPAYRDATVQSGRTYLYSIAAVDVRGNEGARSSEASETVP